MDVIGKASSVPEFGSLFPPVGVSVPQVVAVPKALVRRHYTKLRIEKHSIRGNFCASCWSRDVALALRESQFVV